MSAMRANHGHRRSKAEPVSLIKCLTECGRGEDVEVVSVNAGFNARRRLYNLGIYPGSVIRKKKDAPFRGPLQIIVKGTNIVLGRGLASKIYVRCGESCTFD
ncbi:MAG: ferrous iron transport protein A [Promethearchaeota archaeon]|nr:MAG: ferrous iron transport protein A [Candidatus Lokiarchaeota archaeon]